MTMEEDRIFCMNSLQACGSETVGASECIPCNLAIDMHPRWKTSDLDLPIRVVIVLVVNCSA